MQQILCFVQYFTQLHLLNTETKTSTYFSELQKVDEF